MSARLRRTSIAIAFLILFCCGNARGGMQEDFQRPPASAKPWAYWFWINGNITKEGITEDLEAMAHVGIGGVLIMEVARPNTMAPAGAVAVASPQVRGMFKHAVSEA